MCTNLQHKMLLNNGDFSLICIFSSTYPTMKTHTQQIPSVPVSKGTLVVVHSKLATPYTAAQLIIDPFNNSTSLCYICHSTLPQKNGIHIYTYLKNTIHSFLLWLSKKG